MDLEQLSALEPAYGWKGVFASLKVPASSPVNVTEPEFLKTVNKELESAPIETWKTWLRWRTGDARSQYLSKPFYDEWFHFNQTVLSGVAQQRNGTTTRMCRSSAVLMGQTWSPPAAKFTRSC
jgi:putative endopeptidase